MIGETLAQYKITGLLGKGGMGEMYRARDVRLKREVALKVLPAAMAAAAMLLVVACDGRRGAREAADLVLTNGVVRTMDPGRPPAQAVAVRGGRIAYLGDVAGVAEWIGEATELVDLAGGMVLPGFQDAHVHVLESGIALGDCDLSAAGDAAAVLSVVAACAREDGSGGWLRGGGYELTYFAGGNARAAALDQVVADRPVFLTSSDAHSAWLNSAALELAGITAQTPDPAAGRIERDAATGEPSGTLRETAIDLVSGLLPPRTAAERADGLRRGLAVARSFGVTAFQDANIDADNLAAYALLRDRGELTARVSVSLAVDPARGPSQVSELADLRERYQGGLLRVNTAKLFVDGVIEAQTGALLEPYVGMRDYRGDLRIDRERLDPLVAELDRQGFQIHLHTIGDRAIRVALDALERARARNGARDSRHHLAHVQLWHPEDVPRLRELEVSANFQPLWAYADAFITDLTEPFLGPERSRWLYPIKSLVDSGAEVVFGSDWDVSTMNPLPAIEVGITRQDPADASSRAWLPQERVDLETMLAGYTTRAARVNFLDEETGSIEVGKAADLVVLDRDLASIPAHEIGDAEVVLTLFSGEVVFRAADLSETRAPEAEMGSSTALWPLIGIPLLIFGARLVDVTLSTIRIVFIARGLRHLAPLIGFVEILFWLVAIGQVMQHLDRPLNYFAYAAGFAGGTWIGLLLESKLAIGLVAVRIITRDDASALVEALQKERYGVTSFAARGIKGRVRLLLTVVRRSHLAGVQSLVSELHPNAFVSVEDVRQASEGFFPEPEPGMSGFFRRLRGK